MKTLRSLKVLSACSLAAAAIAFAAPAGADQFTFSVSSCGPGGGFNTYHSRYHRTPEQIERERGEAAGSRAGWRAGFEAGYSGRGYNCACFIDLSCESRWFRRGFITAYEHAYAGGFRAGAAQRQREHCRPNYHHQHGYRGW